MMLRLTYFALGVGFGMILTLLLVGWYMHNAFEAAPWIGALLA